MALSARFTSQNEDQDDDDDDREQYDGNQTLEQGTAGDVEQIQGIVIIVVVVVVGELGAGRGDRSPGGCGRTGSGSDSGSWL